MNYRKNLSGSAAYRSAVPDSLFDVHIEPDEPFSHLLEDTEQALRHWNEQTSTITDEERQALLHREAELSWMLSDGQTVGLFAPSVQFSSHSIADEQDISNQEHAMQWATEMMTELPISRRLLSDAHYLMCKSERYEKKYPGDFRSSPVWIGERGRRLQDDDVFVPPVDDDLTNAFTDLERFVHYADTVHPLIRVGLVHYQLETIHPFIDGNGRIGRLLTLLMLIDYGYLSAPLLQLSEQLSRHSIQYYFNIQNTHLTGNYKEWVRWFLVQLKRAASEGS